MRDNVTILCEIQYSHFRGVLVDLPEGSFNYNQVEFADSECILRQNGDELFHRDEFYVLLCTQVFAGDQVAW